MSESISKLKSKVSWVKGVNGAWQDMQWAGAIGAFYAQEFRKTDLFGKTQLFQSMGLRILEQKLRNP